MLLDQFAELEADFARFYSIDLPTAMWGSAPITVRRFRNLVVALPRESATVRALVPHPDWGMREELLAGIAELVDQGNRWFYSAHKSSSAADPEPVRIRRPWDPAAVPARSSTDDMLRFFGRAARFAPGGDR